MRTIKEIFKAKDSVGELIYAVCNDNTLWQLIDGNWWPLPIPQITYPEIEAIL